MYKCYILQLLMPRKVINIIFILILSFGMLFIYLIVKQLLFQKKKTVSNITHKIPPELLQGGYLICRHGDSLYSEWIIKNNLRDRRYSHIGIITHNKGEVNVIHADTSNRFSASGKVVEESIATYLRHARRIGIFKLQNVNPSLLEEKARNYLGLPFDWKLDLSTNDALYCSELVKKAIDDTNSPIVHSWKTIKVGNQEIVPVDAFIGIDVADELYDWSFSK